MTNFFFFGATGDHARLKIIPALFQLFRENKFVDIKFFAIGRSSKTKEELDEILSSSVMNYNQGNIDQNKLEAFLSKFEYLQIDSEKENDYRKLDNLIDSQNQNFFYLSIPPQNYLKVLKNFNLFNSKLQNSSVILEKPFGLDFESCKLLSKTLRNLFGNNIFRVDHYLGKEKVYDILFKQEVSKVLSSYVTHPGLRKIEFQVFENFGVENRGEFYDKVGALVDVGQNHMFELVGHLQILNQFESFKIENYAELRAKNISNLNILSSKRAQYQGYRKIDKVNPSSNTETYFEIELKSSQVGFENVEISLKSGKKLPVNSQKIIFHFEDKNQIEYNFANDKTNWNEYYFLIKKILDFNEVNCNFFVSDEELEAQWKLIDQVKKDWNNGKVELEIY